MLRPSHPVIVISNLLVNALTEITSAWTQMRRDHSVGPFSSQRDTSHVQRTIKMNRLCAQPSRAGDSGFRRFSSHIGLFFFAFIQVFSTSLSSRNESVRNHFATISLGVLKCRCGVTTTFGWPSTPSCFVVAMAASRAYLRDHATGRSPQGHQSSTSLHTPSPTQSVGYLVIPFRVVIVTLLSVSLLSHPLSFFFFF